MPLSSPDPSMLDSLAAYPRWFVAACLTIVVGVLLWVFAKLLKWTIYFLIGAVLVLGGAVTVWWLLHPTPGP